MSFPIAERARRAEPFLAMEVMERALELDLSDKARDELARATSLHERARYAS